MPTAGTVNVEGGTLSLGNVIQHKTTPLPVTLTGGMWNVTNATLVFTNVANITRNEAVVSLGGSTAAFARYTAALNDNQGSLTLKNDRDLVTAGALINGGSLRVEDAATLLTIGSGGSAAYTQTAGSTTLVGDAQIEAVSINLQGGTFAGTGTLTGNLVSTNNPIVAPGASAGTLTITGTANLTGTLAMEIGGLTPGSGHDQLLVGGNLNLGGNLSLAFINGFTPAFGQNLTLVDAGTTSGSFTNVPSGSRVFTLNSQHSFAVYYGAGSPFGSDKVVLSAFSDIVASVLSLPANITKEATGPATTPVSFSVSANDAVQGSVPATATPTSGSGFALGATTVNVTASDIGGNVANGSFTVTVVDTTPPVLTLPANITAEATGPAGRAVNYTATATDIVDTSPDLLFSPASGSTFPLGTTTVNVSATDNFSNVANGSFTVKIVDTTAPVLTVPSNMTVKATTVAGAVVNFSVSALDLVSGLLSPSVSIPSGSLFPVGTSTVNVTATDAAGNQGTTSFTVQVTTEPDVFIKETTGVEIPEGTGGVVFDSTTVGASSPSKSITIRNDGTDQLVLGAITLDGVSASEFQATTPPLATLAPGGSTSFSITFTPSAIGNRSAMIHLSSNDPDSPEAVYDFALGGIGLPILPRFGSTPLIYLHSKRHPRCEIHRECHRLAGGDSET